MTNSIADPTEDEILDGEISDEALEIAAVAGRMGAYTVALCSGQSVCPV
jgi:hypothetical protein